MPIITVKLTPSQGGKEFQVMNVSDFRIGFGRPIGPNGTPALNGFDLDTIQISRIKSMPDANGKANREEESIRLAAALGPRADHKGEMTVAADNDPTNILSTIRWDHGFICGFNMAGSVHDLREQLVIATPEMKVDNATIPRQNIN